MRALSIRQPLAWLTVNGPRDIDNRTWPTQVRGPVLVHTGQRIDFDIFSNPAMMRRAHRERWIVSPIFRQGGAKVELPPLYELQTGGIVGVVEIVDCVEDSASPWFVGPYGFVLANPRPLPFVPFAGKRQFFDVPDDLLRGVPAVQGSLFADKTAGKYDE